MIKEDSMEQRASSGIQPIKQMAKLIKDPNPAQTHQIQSSEEQEPVQEVHQSLESQKSAGPNIAPNLSKIGREKLDELMRLLEAGQGQELADAIFEADIDGFGEEIDCEWFEKKAAELMGN
jgi:hypothetical protein